MADTSLHPVHHPVTGAVLYELIFRKSDGQGYKPGVGWAVYAAANIADHDQALTEIAGAYLWPIVIPDGLTADTDLIIYVFRRLGAAPAVTDPLVAVEEGFWNGTALVLYAEANVTALSDDATAADNAEAFFDGTGYAGTNNIIPTVTTLTTWDKTGYALTQAFPTNFSSLSIDGTGKVTFANTSIGSVTGAVGSVTGAVGSVAAGVTVTTNNDKTGYALSATGANLITAASTFTQAVVDAVWDELIAAHAVVGSFGAAMANVPERGSGSSTKVYTATVGGVATAGVYCKMFTNSAGTGTPEAAGYTNGSGQVTFSHNLAVGTTVYIFRYKSGVTFTDPDVEEI